jgi:hypothetical protein
MRVSRALAASLFCAASSAVNSVQAQSVADYTVRLSAAVATNPPTITLTWPADPNATGYDVFRKLRDDEAWGIGVGLAGTATQFVDMNVTVGGAYEYKVTKNTPIYYGEGEIYAGMLVPLVEHRGKVILLVDNSFTSSLSNELARLQQDLVGDGWTVLRHDVARAAVDPANTSSSVWANRLSEVGDIKALIKADHTADPVGVKAVFIFGHIPVPYSGDLAPDEHVDHVGAWPADAYYGSLTGTWTDSSKWDQGAGDRRNWNVPGDGKFDPSWLPADVTLQVGRVDLANLPAFSQDETALLRQYLTKNHNFRMRVINAQRRGLIVDHLDVLGGEAPAANGWRNFEPFFGPGNCIANPDWFNTLSTNSYLWGCGCGPGYYTSCGGIGTTSDFATQDPQVVFTMFFGSYFGDWDCQNNFLRAALGTPTYTLTTAWVARPYWFFHHMALGETVGFSTRLSQNNITLYSSGLYYYRVHAALMGDPTLRMHVVAPPTSLDVATNVNGGADLSWSASPDPVLGYHVYTSAVPAGPFTRFNVDLITGTHFADPTAFSKVYMLRAVKLEASGSGTYYNASQGIFQTLSVPPALPAQADRAVTDLTTMTVTNTATAMPSNRVLTYQLLNAPSGAGISSDGIIAWTPTLAQSPGTNQITTVVTDDGTPPLTATNSFTAFVSGPYDGINLTDVNQATADLDGDGLSNLQEYALGTDPRNPADAAQGFTISSTTIGGADYLSVQFKQRHNPQDFPIQYILEVSGDRHAWFSDSAHVVSASTTPIDSQFDWVTARDLTPTTANAPRFIRLRILQN